jgi:aryl-alcohol dehydrogenase-like predicted oxidoreductase
MTFGRQNTLAEAHSQLGIATENGINFFDTAESYPVPPAADTRFVTHEYLSSWLKDQKRDALVLATKVRIHRAMCGEVRITGPEVPNAHLDAGGGIQYGQRLAARSPYPG